jgi:glycosyltransferase involved in cell wall biosynthesis
MRVLFALPGLHRYDRGAETAFIAIAAAIAEAGHDVTLIGSGPARANLPYRFVHARSISRKRFEGFPSLPTLRNDTAYEELTFLPALARHFAPHLYDVTLTCAYPYTNWLLRRPTLSGRRPPHIFVTENGDWPAFSDRAEFRFFSCEGLVCTNPVFYERNKTRWNCSLIPNGIDCDRFSPGASQKSQFGLPATGFVVLMVSALAPNKKVQAGIEAISKIQDAHLVVAGDGPLRGAIDDAARRLLPGRYTRLTVPANDMPQLYRSADVFLHMCEDESFGNVFLEAMASGLPVVAKNTQNTRWIVGDDEFLFEDSATITVADTVIRARYADPTLRAVRVAKVKPFAWPNIGRKYVDFLSEVVARYSSASTAVADRRPL